jgi:predicted dehydrogenase
MKILMIGLGGIGQRHVRNLRSLLGDTLEIMAYRQLNRSFALTDQLKVDEGVNILEKYKIDVYPDINSALDQEPDIAFICNPSNLHIPVALMAARAGCRLFIEKPLSHNLDFVSELIQVIEQKNWLQ